MEPFLLPPNTFDHFYRGGSRIAELRNSPIGTHRPEEWLGSVVTRFGEPTNGLTSFGHRTLRAEIEANPVAWLGPEYVARHGPSPAVLVKLLDPAQRLPVHLHPTRRFAGEHLDCPYGKTEAWVILETEPSGGDVFVGTHRAVAREEWTALVDEQDSDAMLALLRPVEVRAGDAVLVPSGTPHAIGTDLLVLELQEPTDLSILLEWDGFDIDGAADGHLGLGMDVAIGAIRPDALSDTELERLVVRAGRSDTRSAAGSAAREDDTVVSVMPPEADPYFRAWEIRSTVHVVLPAGFGILLIVDGGGRLVHGSGSIDAQRGDAFVVPAAAGPCTLTGRMAAYFSQPPSPTSPEPQEWDT
ncbi:class I mannose-6-phosphate isomerase [Ilumatobacter sp.]|uniref:class I mannose-6-phosphate isomerase n=1 Tax=Ilumatobacter sp. TaxID=1967498 RepID=UPI003AF6F1A3